ncbi:glutaminase [Lentzea sp. BCCO 10_0856]|uniref:Glutaminase n=1 Tax=Lentzea miocenica TaxID=3095431 RepID=A0ABU4SWL7_9PSEU|nr:glutaminase [Lentzea sp. BCCO 10_0856]MDX8030301.1 glutaminase [Lentzea sp. BCCO 10_0856]
MELQDLVDRIASEVTPGGAVADYIPALARIDPHAFGLAVATLDGEVFGAGDYRTPFSIQSISKAFMLALALSQDDGVWTRVGREPSGSPFNSLVQLETEQGIPRNPFINAGALVVTDHLGLGAADRLLDFLRQESGNFALDVDPEVAKSELDHSDRNRALAHFMGSYGNMRNSVDVVVHEYVRQCSIAMSCADLAKATLFLARHGVRNDGTRLLGVSGAKRVNAVMLTCGTYDAAGQFAYRVGLPGKSGVGGGIIAVVPGKCAICVWSPALDARGNSVAGVDALDRFTTLTGWSVF